MHVRHLCISYPGFRVSNLDNDDREVMDHEVRPDRLGRVIMADEQVMGGRWWSRVVFGE
jgi:hypothetical protein